MENRGLLTLKEVNGVASVTSVQRVHELFKGVKVQNPESLRAGTRNKEDDKKDKERGNGKIAVIELYKFPKKMKYVMRHVRFVGNNASIGNENYD